MQAATGTYDESSPEQVSGPAAQLSGLASDAATRDCLRPSSSKSIERGHVAHEVAVVAVDAVPPSSPPKRQSFQASMRWSPSALPASSRPGDHETLDVDETFGVRLET
jgi:hypothetical protein